MRIDRWYIGSPRAPRVSWKDTLLGTFFLVPLLVLIGCAGQLGSDVALRESLAAEANELARALLGEAGSPTAGTLEVRLAFGARSDLDLYVTDPTQETAYFANNPTKLGARLTQDVRCDVPAPRVELVSLADPLPGRYRVGVDYPQTCGRDRGPVSFVIYFDANGTRESRRGSIEPGEFLAIVMEADVE